MKRDDSNRALPTSRLSRPLSLLLLWGALFLTSVAAFYPALDAPFVSDDLNAIVANEYVTQPLGLGEIFNNFSWWGRDRSDAPGFRPLVTATFALEHQNVALAPRSYHLTNLALHAAVGCALWWVALALGASDKAALAISVLFTLLPIHSEAVIWIVGRAELMATLGFAAVLGACLAYRRTGSGLYLALASIGLLFGLLSKENAITALATPIILALLPRRSSQSGGEDVGGDATPWPKRELVVFATLVAVTVAYLGLRAHAGGPLFVPQASVAADISSEATATTDNLDNPLLALNPAARVAGALSVLGRYAGLLVWPTPLSIDYSFEALPLGGLDPWAVLGAAIILATAAGAWATRTRASTRFVFVGLGLCAASYSIVSNLIVPIGTVMGERLVYMPTFGLALACVPMLERGLDSGNPARTQVTLAMVAVLSLIWFGVNFDRARDWDTPVTLYEATVAAVPGSARAHMELASAYGHEGRREEALGEFAKALAIKPDYAAAAYNMGNMLARNGQLERAIAAFRQALGSAPAFQAAWTNLATAYTLNGQPAMALAALKEAVEQNPKSASLNLSAAEMAMGQGQFEDAAVHYDAVLRLGSAVDPSVRFARGAAIYRTQGCAAAIDDFTTSLAQGFNEPIGREMTRTCLIQLGRGQEIGRIAPP